MKIKNKEKYEEHSGTEWAENLWEVSWAYMRTMVDTVRQPFLVLDEDLRVIAANRYFYRFFQVFQHDTEQKFVYDLGNGQWNISALRRLLEDILPKGTSFNNFKVEHNFPGIGRKVMLLNARRVYKVNSSRLPRYVGSHPTSVLPPTIILAMEDITDLAPETGNSSGGQAGKSGGLDDSLAAQLKRLEVKIDELARSANSVSGLKKSRRGTKANS